MKKLMSALVQKVVHLTPFLSFAQFANLNFPYECKNGLVLLLITISTASHKFKHIYPAYFDILKSNPLGLTKLYFPQAYLLKFKENKLIIHFKEKLLKLSCLDT